MNCDCQDWKENIEKVNAPLMLASARSGGKVQYDGKCFKFCPWCALPLHDAGEVTEAVGQSAPVATSQILEPSDRNALNLQMALDRILSESYDGWQGGCAKCGIINVIVLSEFPKPDPSPSSSLLESERDGE